MTRFDATEPTARQTLFADAVTAHRERASEFLTLEPGTVSPQTDDGDDLVPWIQFSGTTVSMDCTDSELDRLKALLDEYPDFRIETLTSPEGADGTHVQISARSDAPRLASFFDSVFQQVFGYDAGYRGWVVSI